MKESIKDICSDDIVTKTKTTFQELLSGVKSLFRPYIDTKENQKLPQHPNNHLKSPDEIEAEFRSLSVLQKEEENTQTVLNGNEKVSVVTTSESHFTMNIASELLPEYMEENY